MKEVRGNVIVGQSGGPTAVINSSLAGVYKTAKDRGAKKVFGMLHGTWICRNTSKMIWILNC